MKAELNQFNHNSEQTLQLVVTGGATSEIRHCGWVLANTCHSVAHACGWWLDPATGEPKDRNVGELLCLVHSEISEAMEGARKDLQDQHLPHYKNFHVELADAVIRIFDIAGAEGVNLGEIIAEKLQYNAKRADHKLSNRAEANGKKF